MKLGVILLVVFPLFAVAFILVRMIRAAGLYVKLLGKRIVTCPETKKPAAVDVDAGPAAWGALFNHGDFRLSDCSRWPEREDCGQACLSQIEVAPDDCLVTHIVEDWYRGRSCAFCGGLFGEMNWMDRRGALFAPNGKTVLWEEVSPEDLPGVLATHQPVCWSCHIAQTFRRQHPDIVIDRPWKRVGPCGEISGEPKNQEGKPDPHVNA